MPPVNRAALLTKTHRVLKKHYKAVSPDSDRTLLEHLLFASCLENAPPESAEKVYQAVLDRYFDLNEIRVTTVRELVVKIDIKGDAKEKSKSLINGFTDIKSALELVVGAVKIAGKAIASFTTDIANSGDEIAKNAKNIGITAESLQELTFAAKLSGASAREVQTAIQRMGKGLNDARRTGTGPFNDALEPPGRR